MARYRQRSAPVHGDQGHAWLARSKAVFLELQGAAAVAQRQAEIDALPVVSWKGRTLYTLRCTGDFGRGPHDMHVPEALLWNLISFARYKCAFHR